jgi:hypothetical protein
MNSPGMLTRAALAAPFVWVLGQFAGCMPPRAMPPDDREAAGKRLQLFEQMNWPLQDGLGFSARNALQKQVEELIVEGSPDSLPRAVALLNAEAAELPANGAREISESGRTDEETSAKLRQFVAAAYEQALLYALTGDSTALQRAREILLRFAEVYPQWPFYDREGEIKTRDDRSYLRHWRANGLWNWHPLDLAASLPLLRAYDLIKPALTPEEREQLRTNLFVHHKDLIDRFTGIMPSYHNLAGNHLVPLIRFGQVLERPDYIHEVVDYWERFMRHSYSVDGFFKEVTPGYHNQITSRMIGLIPRMLEGYSDPPGYIHPETGRRFDNLNLADLYPWLFERVGRAVDVLTLPDRTYVTINDAHPPGTPGKSGARAAEEARTDQPALLGISGLAKLGVGDMVAFLQFGGIRGHDHDDALNLVWYAAGGEVFSDTGYQPIAGSGSTREWHTITASHNTVAVDRQTQFSNREGMTVPDSYGGWTSKPPEVPGQHRVEAALPAAAKYWNQGRLLLWNGENRLVQGMEAAQENAYPGTVETFRRAVFLVPLEGDEGYLIDVFRISGGSTHDYFLRGGLAEDSTMNFDLDLEPASGTDYQYIELLKKGVKATAPLRATIEFSGGKRRVVSNLAVIFGTPDANLEILVGEAPAIRRTGKAPFSIVRRESSRAAQLESTFVWVHEATQGKSKIRSVSAQETAEGIVVKVELDGREDVLLSGVEPDSRMEFEAIEFQGRAAFVSKSGEEIAGVVLSGGELRSLGRLLASGPGELTGEVVRTQERDRGDPRDGIFLRVADGVTAEQARDFRLVHLDFEDVCRFSIPIRAAQIENGLLFVELAHAPGFEINEGESIMTSFPGWRIQGSVRATLE